jgi:hypothetical protein
MYADKGLSRQLPDDVDTSTEPLGKVVVLAQRSAIARAAAPSAAGRKGTETAIRDGLKTASPWLAAAEVYAAALRSGVVPGALPSAHDAAPQIVSLRLDAEDVSSLAGQLKDLHNRLSAGDMVIVDAPGSAPTGIARAQLASALFEGGFDCPLIWAGRKALRAESSHRFPTLVLPSRALGAGPRRFPGVAAPLDPKPDRIVAMARRSALSPPGERTLRLSVVMPVYNERATFREVIDRLLAKTLPGMEIEICLVESNSTDGTRDEALRYAQHPRVRVILEDKPSGKGHAVRAGLAAASGDFVLIQDADLEYDLDDYAELLAPLRDGAGFILGSRHPAGERFWQVRQFSQHPTAARVLNVGHLVFAGMLNVVFGQKMRDPFTMFKVFRRDAIHNVRFDCDRFDFDIELVAKLIRQGYAPREINIRYNARSFEDGKKIRLFKDPPTWVRACLRHRFSMLHQWPGPT